MLLSINKLGNTTNWSVAVTIVFVHHVMEAQKWEHRDHYKSQEE
ncbi:hypothetical protein [Gracilibacillus dipsosauri]